MNLPTLSQDTDDYLTRQNTSKPRSHWIRMGTGETVAHPQEDHHCRTGLCSVDSVTKVCIGYGSYHSGGTSGFDQIGGRSGDMTF